jgi:hypothetical protein
MKKLLLSFSCCGLVVFFSSAQAPQCTPDSQYADSIYGAWPDTLTNFPPATVNAYYETVLNFKAPAAVTADLDPTGQFVGSPIQEYKVTTVDGLPSCFQYACNNSTCTYAGGIQGCATLYGTCSAAGTFPIVINLDVTVLVTLFPGLPPTPVPQQASFRGYKIIVSDNQALLTENSDPKLIVSPNPTNDNFSVNGLNMLSNASEIILTNAEGKVLAKRTPGSSNFENFELNNMKSGIYFVNIVHSSGVETIKILKQ